MIRRTKQREAIFRALQTAGRPLTAHEIHELGKMFSPKLGLRTVYRHLRELCDEKRVVGVDYPGQPQRYEVVNPKGHTLHFICRGCAKLFDLEMDSPGIKVTPPPGYSVVGEEIILYGYCPECSEPES